MSNKEKIDSLLSITGILQHPHMVLIKAFRVVNSYTTESQVSYDYTVTKCCSYCLS